MESTQETKYCRMSFFESCTHQRYPQVLKNQSGRAKTIFLQELTASRHGLIGASCTEWRKVAKMILAKSDVKIKTARTSSNADGARVSKNNTEMAIVVMNRRVGMIYNLKFMPVILFLF